MAVYAIGDVQGCYDELQRLLERLRYDPACDRLWFCGDLVNRGPHSLEVLRFVRGLGGGGGAPPPPLLGNHDLHLLAIAAGNERKKENGSLDAILDAPDRDELLHWLRHRPLMHADDDLGFCLIHAGLPPQWDKTQALACAAEVQEVLRDEHFHIEFFDEMYGNRPVRWSGKLRGTSRWRFIVNCFTRLRYCDLSGNLGLNHKGPPGSQGVGWLPWFKIPGRRSGDSRILFGHWSTLGYVATDNVWALDTGCLWGGELTALAVDAWPPTPLHLRCPRVLSPG